ncbi:hypothetical protein GCM10028773_50870 [Spirosoma koreense]
MNFFSKSVFTAFLGVALISSCSRPVAYLQPTTREQFKTAQSEPVTVTSTDQSIAEDKAENGLAPATAQPVGSVQPMAQAKQMMRQLDTYVRNDNALVSNKKLTRRMASINQFLTNAEHQSTVANQSKATQKTTLMQRLMIKKINRNIKHHLSPASPERAMAKSVLTVGLIIGIIGLIFLLLSVAPPLGLILLLVGLVLVLVDLIR